MHFLNTDHRKRMTELIQRDHTHERDLERQAMFYIFSGAEDLYRKVNHLYDFTLQIIKPETLDTNTVDLTSSARALVRAAYSLYNGYPADVRDTFTPLDEDNRRLMLEALCIRFRLNDDKEASA